MLYKKIEVDQKLLKNGCIDCKERCPLDRECANHTSAGEFRSEDGLTPKLKVLNNTISCASYFDKKENHCNFGALYFIDNKLQFYNYIEAVYVQK